jgi:phage baseplate assembly protein V
MIRGIIKTLDEGPIKVVSSYCRVDELIEGREYMQHYGFTSRPLAGAEGIYISRGNHYVMVASDDRRYRLPVAGGEVAIYTDEGDFIHLKRNKEIYIKSGNKLTADIENDVEVNAKNAAVNASETVAISSPDITLDGDARVTGDLTVEGDLRVNGSLIIGEDGSLDSVIEAGGFRLRTPGGGLVTYTSTNDGRLENGL